MNNPRPAQSRSRPSYDGPEIGFDVRFFWCCCCLFFTLLTIILIAVSIRDIDYGNWGVAYNKLTCELNQEPFEQGKHVMRPETELLKYNSLTISTEFSGGSLLHALTFDGLDVTMDLEIQYQLNKPELINVVMEFGAEEKLTEFLRVIAAASIRDIACLKTAQQFYEERAEIEKEITTALTTDLANANAHISLRLVQMRNLQLPSALMTTIEDKQRAELDITNAQNEREQAITEADIVLQTAEIEAETQIIEATQEANSRIAEATENAIAITARLSKRWEVWLDIKTNTGMSASDFVNNYLKAVVISEVHNPLVGIRRSDDDDA